MTYRSLLLLVCASHWPVWLWYCGRMTDGSDEPWGALALISSFVFIPWRRLGQKVPTRLLIFVLLAEVFFQIVVVHWVPLLRGLFVVGLVAAMLLSIKAPSGILGLLCLSLPWIATLQFYLGFPLRVLTGAVTSWLLHVVGFEVQREGVVLLWENHQVVIDRPCAGIYMLWFGGYLTYFLASWYRLSLKQCLGLGTCSFFIILGMNILRNFLLFFIETDFIQLPEFAHEAIGLVIFLVAITFLAKITETQVPGRAL